MRWHSLIAAILCISVTSTDVLPFREQCLKIHNRYRKIHQVADVEWSERLEKKAKDWANELAENNKFKHSPSSDENLYMSSGFQPTEYCTTAVTRMYESEEKRYNYSRPGWAAKYGHFTMIVWKRTTTIGAAWAFRKDGRLVVVIKYAPPGNVASAKAYRNNVFPPLPTTGPPPVVETGSAVHKASAGFVVSVVLLALASFY